MTSLQLVPCMANKFVRIGRLFGSLSRDSINPARQQRDGRDFNDRFHAAPENFMLAQLENRVLA